MVPLVKKNLRYILTLRIITFLKFFLENLINHKISQKQQNFNFWVEKNISLHINFVLGYKKRFSRHFNFTVFQCGENKHMLR